MSTQARRKPETPGVHPDRQGAEEVVRSRGFERLARAGFAARGVVYVVIGVLAIRLALGVPGGNASQQGALRAVVAQPFGEVLLILIALGLAGYSLWRLLRAALGHGREDSDSGFDRLAALGSGLAYAALAAIAVEILLGSGGGGSGNAQKTTAGVLGWPGGPWLVAIAGVALIGIAAYQGYQGLSRDFLENSKTEQMSSRMRAWVEWIGVLGHLARAVVYGLVGLFLIAAAVHFDPKRAVGVDGALARLAQASYGPFVLGLVATGLVAFGAYSLSDARYRRI
jgi:hypothetical protein